MDNSKFKYPRTHHVPWSPGATNDDKIIKDLSHFEGEEVVLTLKMDGENTTMMKPSMYASSLDNAVHPSQHVVKGTVWSVVKNAIPDRWRVCGENLYALHSIPYNDLDSFFQVFSVWNEQNNCISWDRTVEFCDQLNLVHVPVLWRGIYDEDFLRNIKLDLNKQEGWVLRLTREFSYDDFNKRITYSNRRTLEK